MCLQGIDNRLLQCLWLCGGLWTAGVDGMIWLGLPQRNDQMDFHDLFSDELQNIAEQNLLPPKIREELCELRSPDEALALVDFLSKQLEDGVLLGLFGIHDDLTAQQQRNHIVIFMLIFGLKPLAKKNEDEEAARRHKEILLHMGIEDNHSIVNDIKNRLIEWVFAHQQTKIEGYPAQADLLQRKSAEFIAVSALLNFAMISGIDVSQIHDSVFGIEFKLCLSELMFLKVIRQNEQYRALSKIAKMSGYRPGYTTGFSDSEMKTSQGDQNSPPADPQETPILRRIGELFHSDDRAITAIFSKLLVLENNRVEESKLNIDHVRLLERYVETLIYVGKPQLEFSFPQRLQDSLPELGRLLSEGPELFGSKDEYWGNLFAERVSKAVSKNEKTFTTRLFSSPVSGDFEAGGRRFKNWRRLEYFVDLAESLGEDYLNLAEGLRRTPRLPLPELIKVQVNVRDRMQLSYVETKQGEQS